MAYASTSSPFASIKGQNIFSSSANSVSSSAIKTPLPSSPALGRADVLLSAGTKRTGFEAFASSSSPFASVAKSKSPVLGGSGTFGSNSKGGSSAFTVYASGGVQSFALPLTKRARGAGDFWDSSTLGKVSDDEEVNGDEEWDEARPKVNLNEQEVSTGEELEETIHQVRGKLFALADGAWKERGTGQLKINVRAEDRGGARLVMRKEAVYTLLLNVTLFAGMKYTLAQDPRYVRFSLANAKIASELMEAIHENLPEK
ncbi:hypothetical protein F5879DRAFT_1010332 [Lentinula edodes]|nr:hypothetical protein F5879DRAFT_1010332 [Lentinula edodes]